MYFPDRNAFEEGEVILKEYETSQGFLEIAGEVRIEDEGKT
jgi:hypothetical protein